MPRLYMLKAFLEHSGGLDYNYFLTQQYYPLDRTTIFRTLNLFVIKKVIYRIPAPDGAARYLLQPDTAKPSIVDHVSFICSQCRNVVPLDTLAPPKIKLPGGFLFQSMEILINGLCKSCSSLSS